MAKIEIDASEVTVFLNKNLGEKLPKNFNTRKLVTDIANTISARIKVRTQSGRDVENKPFKPYAESSRKFRSKKGRQTGHVDLFFRGQMLAGVTATTKSDVEAVVSLLDAIQQKKAAAHQFGTKRLPQRKFFGLSDKDTTTIKAIEKIQGDALDEALKKT